uniref:Uncharacterized protein n=1 Tax=Anguilla anguilla TaxID=7936 RepID=A0A0E9X2W0_ANGAN
MLLVCWKIPLACGNKLQKLNFKIYFQLTEHCNFQQNHDCMNPYILNVNFCLGMHPSIFRARISHRIKC